MALEKEGKLMLFIFVMYCMIKSLYKVERNFQRKRVSLSFVRVVTTLRNIVQNYKNNFRAECICS